MLEQMGLTQGVLEFTKNFSSSLSGNNNEQSDGNVFVASMMSLFNGTILDSDTGGYNGDGGDGGNQPPIFDPRRQTQTLFKVQLYVCTTLGLFLFLTFCLLRYKFPLFFSIRSYRNKKIKKLPNNMFSWIKILISINNEQLLEVIGLESYVFLCFFRMSIKILMSLSILGLCILSPIRYWMLGTFDRDDTSLGFISNYLARGNDPDDENAEPVAYLVICTIFTYIFTGIIFWFLFKETNHIIKVRQRFLGSQRSLTDRTIFIKNIPKEMCNEEDLKSHIEELKVGKIDQIRFVYDYSPLIELYNVRDGLIRQLEIKYSQLCGLDIQMFDSVNVQNVHLKVVKSENPPSKDKIVYNPYMKESCINDDDNSDAEYYILNIDDEKYEKKKRSCVKVEKSDKEIIDESLRRLIKINDDINECRASNQFKRLPLAFVTMDSVTDAQMAAQAVFSPKVFELITELAPAPMDINWGNLLMSNRTLFFRKNIIEFIIILFSILLIIPIRYITSLLNINAIRKMWKEFGDYLLKHEFMRTIVTGLLPTYLFTIINVILPYVISSLSSLQGLRSKGDVELSVIKKNFLYIFFNLFLVFTLFGTLSSYKALLTDTTKIAPLLATSIKSLSLFYIDLIILQGLTMFPFKLLQIGDLSMIFWNFIVNNSKKTPRMFRDLIYNPPIFDLGLILPQHLVIFIITILYSSISTKILVSGMVYFILGFYTYKYQLVYSLVHPYHSTGKAWPIIFKRVCLGVFFLHLQMFGSVALEQSFILAGFMLPLFPVTIIALMVFNKDYQPLLDYIALDAIKTKGRSVDQEPEDDGLDTLLLNTGISGSAVTQNKFIQRKTSAVSLFLDGDDNCDAVVVNKSSGSDTSNVECECLTDADNAVDDEIHTSGVNNNYHDANLSASPSSSTVSPPNFTPLTSNLASLNNNIPLRRKCSTIEEEREATQCYIHPCLLDENYGLMVGFCNDDIDYLNFRITSSSEGFALESQMDGQQVDLRVSSECHEDEDLEVARGIVSGYVTRKNVSEEVW
ncbi:uncharacterized protein C5L36_0E02500 [Pichia kudriavzevii]|uniref:Calcium permeable stress-gated cation channel 1 n=1 Tax=Pichia kudriavzevii TaxID=4909 RepID=A0A2U9RAX9_PICKU|nr:uncharacterized protein C5L36_0E02500 [Pichia kudriavzevii]AWU78186.1 hypothetical protein C5L36_0E02500 [Pichia kudriavzevii]